ncbi:DUF1499 domain-containing protein [Oricola sp.]|uniref:DUF1499 domain-containing protein n=1 Tax=Oricola sp. TaxID=1979950 RepID=UPI003BAC06C8
MAKRYRNSLILRPLPPRPRSALAAWAVRVALFVPVFAVISLLAYRSGSVDEAVLRALVWIVLAVALLGIVLVVGALRSLWVYGTRGGRQTIFAILLLIPTLTPYAAAAFLAAAMPHQSDVSTDLVNPPMFRSEIESENVNRPALVAATLGDGYASLTGRRYRAAPDAIEATVLAVADTSGWRLETRRGRASADDELFFQFENRIPVLGLPAQMVLRITDEGDSSFVDLRGRVLHVSHDLGWNARVIERYLQTLDYELVAIADVEPI